MHRKKDNFIFLKPVLGHQCFKYLKMIIPTNYALKTGFVFFCFRSYNEKCEKKVEKFIVSWNILPRSSFTMHSKGMVLIYPKTRAYGNSNGPSN